jgi:circadian clock protein KaiC
MVDKGLLQFHAMRPTLFGLEMHLANTHKIVNLIKPQVVVLDPMNTFRTGDNEVEVKTMLIRLVDFLKMNQITALFTSLTTETRQESADSEISSLIDTLLSLRSIEISGERNRGIYVLKSRGMSHSNQIREFLLTDNGVELRDVYTGQGGVLTGSARLAQEAVENAQLLSGKNEIDRKRREINRKRVVVEAQIVALQADFEAVETEALKIIETEQNRISRMEKDHIEMAKNRKADDGMK